MADQPNILVIDYVSTPKRRPRKTFAGLYVTFGAINIVIAGSCLLIELFAIAGLLGANRSVWISLYDLFILAAIGFALDTGILVGSMASFWRMPWSRRILKWSFAGQIAIALLFLLTSGLTNMRDPSTLPGNTTVIVLFAVFRGPYAFLFLIAYSNIRADFYSDIRDDPTPIEPIHSPLQPQTPTFRVRGIDAATGNPTEFTSNAPTPDLAAKSAISLGVIESSIHIEKI